MNMAKLAVLLGAIVLASGGIGAALAESRNSSAGGVEPIDIEARKNESDDDDGVLLFAGDDDDDDNTNGGTNTGGGNTGGGTNTGGADTGGGDDTNATGGASQAAVLAEGRSAAQWMASATLYKERWLQMKAANNRHAQQVRNLRASRAQARVSAPRAVRSGGPVYRGGGGSNSGGGSVSGGGDT